MTKYVIKQLETIDSTNKYLKENYQNFDEYTLVYTTNQTNGRGRYERQWQNNANQDLAMSLLLKPTISNEVIPNLCLLTGAAVFLTLQDYTYPLIKWPNDIIVNDKKICGILLESIFFEKIEALIIGVGINVNSQSLHHEISSKAISLKQVINQDVAINQLVKSFIKNFDYLYQKFLTSDNEYYRIIKENNYLKNKKVFYNNQEVIAKDILENGNLLVEEKSELKEIYFGEVSFEKIY